MRWQRPHLSQQVMHSLQNGFPKAVEGFDEMQACVKAHDVAFLNLESTFHDREGIPSALSHGTWAMEDGKITEVQLYPVTLNMEKYRSQKGRPVMNKSEDTLQYLAKLSEPYGTKIEIVDGVGYIYF